MELFGAIHHFSFHNKSHKGKEFKVQQDIRSWGCHKRELKKEKKNAYLRVFAYPHVLSSPAPRNSTADNLAVSEELGFLY